MGEVNINGAFLKSFSILMNKLGKIVEKRNITMVWVVIRPKVAHLEQYLTCAKLFNGTTYIRNNVTFKMNTFEAFKIGLHGNP